MSKLDAEIIRLMLKHLDILKQAEEDLKNKGIIGDDK